MKLGAMKAQLPWSLEQADLAFCYGGGLGWDAAEALRPRRSVAAQRRRPAGRRLVAAASRAITFSWMSNGGFGGVYAKPALGAGRAPGATGAWLCERSRVVPRWRAADPPPLSAGLVAALGQGGAS